MFLMIGWQEPRRHGGRGLPPEFRQAIDAALWRIARNDRCVDGADRNSGYPAGPKRGRVEGLVDSALVGSQRSASLKHEHDFLASLGIDGHRVISCECRLDKD